jgi:diguanylate cyclase (GGDEF)-like protein
MPANAADADVLARVRLLTTLARTRTELEAAREQLRTQLQTDDQTRLLNRRFFFQAAHRECSRARRYNSELSCLMIEVDHFKRLCQITGFDCGEAMLRAVALVLRDLTRDSDIVSRFDEDKFAILLPETTIEGATRLREKIQQAVMASDFSWHSTPIPLSVSGGEANRNREVRAAEEAAHRLDLEDETPEEYIDGEPLSAREELAELLAAADAALFVARRGVRFPTLTGEYATEKPKHSLEGENLQLPTLP